MRAHRSFESSSFHGMSGFIACWELPGSPIRRPAPRLKILKIKSIGAFPQNAWHSECRPARVVRDGWCRREQRRRRETLRRPRGETDFTTCRGRRGRRWMLSVPLLQGWQRARRNGIGCSAPRLVRRRSVDPSDVIASTPPLKRRAVRGQTSAGRSSSSARKHDCRASTLRARRG